MAHDAWAGSALVTGSVRSVLVGALALSVSACVSLAGLTGGSDGGGRSDAGDSGHSLRDGSGPGDGTTTVKDAKAEASRPSDATAEAMQVGPDAGSQDAQASGDGGLNCATADATICDDFARSVVIPAGDPYWQNALCDVDAGASIKVGGSLEINQPVSSAGTQCYLQSLSSAVFTPPVLTAGGFRAEFDVTVNTAFSTSNVLLLNVDIHGSESFTGQQQLFQLLVEANGSGQLLVFYSRDNYKPHFLGHLYTPPVWLAPGSRCHIAVVVDASTPSATTTSNCGGGAQALIDPDTDLPSGITGAMVVELGYQSVDAQQQWSLAYNNFLFWALP